MLINSINFKPTIYNSNIQGRNIHFNRLNSDVFFCSRKNETENNKVNNEEHKKIAEKFLDADYEDLVLGLLNSDVSNPVGHLIKIDDNEDTPVHLSILNGKTNDYEFYHYSKEEFLDILNKLKNMQTEEYPEEKENYDEITTFLTKKLIS